MAASILEREIHEQPDVLARLLSRQEAPLQALADAVRAQGITQVVIAARGTSDNAARYAKYLWGARNGLLVSLATPSLFTVYHEPPRLTGTLVLGISQSGKSPDIVAVLAAGRRQGALTAAFTNTPDSALAAEADHVIALEAGAERSVAATKTYTASLVAIGLFSAALAGDAAMAAALARAPDAMARVLAMAPALQRAVERYRYMEHCVVIGRGYNYATAFEWALKIKELTYTVVEAYSSADFLHGPLALLERGFPVFVLAPAGPMVAELEGFVARALSTKAEVVAISNREAILKQARLALPLPVTVAAWLSPLTTIVPGQLFAMYLAATRGYDVDEPRALQKVTETL